MNISVDQQGSSRVAVVESSEVVINDVQEALDLMASIRYTDECDKIVLDKSNISEDFFELRTKLAGNILQKYTNYGIRLAIVGDFDGYDSKSLKDFMFECNKGNRFFFVPDKQAALLALHRTP